MPMYQSLFNKVKRQEKKPGAEFSQRFGSLYARCKTAKLVALVLADVVTLGGQMSMQKLLTCQNASVSSV